MTRSDGDHVADDRPRRHRRRREGVGEAPRTSSARRRSPTSRSSSSRSPSARSTLARSPRDGLVAAEPVVAAGRAGRPGRGAVRLVVARRPRGLVRRRACTTRSRPPPLGELADATDEYDDALGATSRTFSVRLDEVEEVDAFPVRPRRRPGAAAGRAARRSPCTSTGRPSPRPGAARLHRRARRRRGPPLRDGRRPAGPVRASSRPRAARSDPLSVDDERGELPFDGEPRPQTWSTAPVFLVPEGSEITQVLVWWRASSVRRAVRVLTSQSTPAASNGAISTIESAKPIAVSAGMIASHVFRTPAARPPRARGGRRATGIRSTTRKTRQKTQHRRQPGRGEQPERRRSGRRTARGRRPRTSRTQPAVLLRRCRALLVGQLVAEHDRAQRPARRPGATTITSSEPRTSPTNPATGLEGARHRTEEVDHRVVRVVEPAGRDPVREPLLGPRPDDHELGGRAGRCSRPRRAPPRTRARGT